MDFGSYIMKKKGVLQFTAFNSSRARVINGETSFNEKTENGIGIGSSKKEIEGILENRSKDWKRDS